MQENPVDKDVDNAFAAIFTMMLPGLGQMLKGRVIFGIICSMAVGGGYLIDGHFGLLLHLLCILDAAFQGGIKVLLKNSTWMKRLFFLLGLILIDLHLSSHRTF